MCNSKTGQNIFLHVPNTMGGTDSFKIIFIKVVFLGFITWLHLPGQAPSAWKKNSK